MIRLRTLIPGFALVLAAPLVARTVRVITDPALKFDASHTARVEQAALLAVERMASTEVAMCAFRNSWRGVPTRDKWGVAMGVMRRYEDVEIRIYGTQDALGSAAVGIAKMDKKHEKWLGLQIALNHEKLGYYTSDSDFDLGLWANVIAHEIAHNLGYTHGSASSDWEETYAGYFITEMGFCVASEGKTGSDRDDLELRRVRKARFKLK